MQSDHFCKNIINAIRRKCILYQMIETTLTESCMVHVSSVFSQFLYGFLYLEWIYQLLHGNMHLSFVLCTSKFYSFLNTNNRKIIHNSKELKQALQKFAKYMLSKSTPKHKYWKKSIYYVIGFNKTLKQGNIYLY